MALNLPEPRGERLERSPLKLVICQVRYSKSPAASKLRAARTIQEALGGRSAWRLNQIENQSIEIVGSEAGDRPATALSSQAGWRLTLEPAGWTVTLLPDSVAIETTRYDNWRDFSTRFGVLLGAVKKAVNPEAAGRLGLRYVDRIEDPRVSSPAEWEPWLQPEVLGITRHTGLGGGVVAAQQQVEIVAGDGLKATIRHGFLRDEESDNVPYLMDFDTYREGVSEFDVASIQADVGGLHRLAIQLFQSMITDPLYQYLLRKAP